MQARTLLAVDASALLAALLGSWRLSREIHGVPYSAKVTGRAVFASVPLPLPPSVGADDIASSSSSSAKFSEVVSRLLADDPSVLIASAAGAHHHHLLTFDEECTIRIPNSSGGSATTELSAQQRYFYHTTTSSSASSSSASSCQTASSSSDSSARCDRFIKDLPVEETSSPASTSSLPPLLMLGVRFSDGRPFLKLRFVPLSSVPLSFFSSADWPPLPAAAADTSSSVPSTSSSSWLLEARDVHLCGEDTYRATFLLSGSSCSASSPCPTNSSAMTAAIPTTTMGGDGEEGTPLVVVDQVRYHFRVDGPSKAYDAWTVLTRL